MKLLFVAHSFPFPLHEGVRLHVYHLLKQLSTEHEIRFVCFIESSEEERHISEIAPFCRSVETVLRRASKNPVKRLANILFQSTPFSVKLFESEQMRQVLEKNLREWKPDVLHLDFTVMAQYADPSGPEAQVFFPHDAMSMLFERNIAHEPNLLYRAYTAAQARKMARYEEKILPWFDRTATVAPADKAFLEKRSPGTVIVSIPNGVDCDYFHPFENVEKPDVVLFRGLMEFLPNHDAAMFFISEVLPFIWKNRPKTEFWVVGPNASPSLLAKAQQEPRIRILGFAPDIREPMAQASVIVSPMRIGSGIKNKILESMAMAKPVVASTMSLPGIDAEPEKDLLVGDTAETLAQQTIRLLADPGLRRQIGQHARSFAVTRHSWKSHAAAFTKLYQDAVVAHAARRKS